MESIFLERSTSPATAASRTGTAAASPSGGVTAFWLHPVRAGLNQGCWTRHTEGRRTLPHPKACFPSSVLPSLILPQHRGGQAWQLTLSAGTSVNIS